MGDALLTRLQVEHDQKATLIRSYAQAASDEGRDLTETEQETIGAAKKRMGELKSQIDLLADDLELADETKNKLRMLDPNLSGAPSQYERAGDVLYDILHQNDADSRTRLGKAMKRAAEHMGTDKANTVATAGDLGGLVVKPNVGAVIDPYPRGMPFATALGLYDAPNSLHFMRPKIDDPNFATGVGQQGTAGDAGKEKAELPSKAFDVKADPVALHTVGGYLNISQQLISLQPGSLDLIIGHMNRRLANAIEKAVVGAVTGTGATPIAGGTTAAQMQKAIFDAAAAYFTATGSLPEWIAFGPTGWARLGGLTDAAGRPLFPFLGAANAMGTARADEFAMYGPAGLRPVVTPAITDSKLYVGGADGVEGFIYRFPVLEAVEPSVLGRQVAVAAAIGTYNPIDDSVQVIS